MNILGVMVIGILWVCVGVCVSMTLFGIPCDEDFDE